MTKYGDFGQNRQNWSTSNACRIAGTHNAFRFFSFKTHIAEQKKLHMEDFCRGLSLQKILK